MTPEEEAIFERAQELKRQSQQVCLVSRPLLLPSNASRTIEDSLHSCCDAVMLSYCVLRTERRWGQVIAHSQSTRKAIGGNLVDHFKFLLVMGPMELKKEIKARFEAWDTDKTGSLSRTEMMVIQNYTHAHDETNL